MAEFSKVTQKRITFLSVFETLGGDYDAAIATVDQLEEDGFFEEETRPARRSGGSGNGRSGGRSGGSSKRGSGSRKSSRGNEAWRDDPATDSQIDKAIEVGALEDGYSEEELEAMTKGKISDLIDSLK